MGWVYPQYLTWPVAKRFKLFGITYLVGKISRSNFFFQGPLAKWDIATFDHGTTVNLQELMAWGDHRTFVDLHAKDRKVTGALVAVVEFLNDWSTGFPPGATYPP